MEEEEEEEEEDMVAKSRRENKLVAVSSLRTAADRSEIKPKLPNAFDGEDFQAMER